MTALMQLAQGVLARQPFSQLMQARIVKFVEGEAELRMPLREDITQQHGFAHGGAVSYLADNTLTFAGGSMLGDCVTAEYKINYLRPAIGRELVARARVVHAGKRQAVCICEILVEDDDGSKVIAHAQGTINKV